MTPRPLLGLSKAAANRRRNHQIPRKRPTQIPLLRPQHHDIDSPNSPSAPKKSPGRPPKRKFDSQPLQTRGETRNTVAGSNSNPTIHRITASRRKPTDPSVLEYKIQWDTSWENASAVKGAAVQDWQDALDDKETFTFKAQDGGKWTVLKDSHKRENDSEDLQWEMWLSIRRNVIEEANKDGFAGLLELDFIFANDGEEMKALVEAEKNGLPQPTSALMVLQTAWQDHSQSSQLRGTEMLYGDVKILFIAQLDPACNVDSGSSAEMYRPALTIADIVRHIHAGPFNDLDEQAFNQSDGTCTYENFILWRKVTKHLIRQAPFIFRTGTWMQLFAHLLLGSEIFEAELAAVGIEVQDDWCMRAREYAMHMYYDRIVDDRPIHDIQETFLSLRDFFRNLGPNKDHEGEEQHVASAPLTHEYAGASSERKPGPSLDAIYCYPPSPDIAPIRNQDAYLPTGADTSYISRDPEPGLDHRSRGTLISPSHAVSCYQSSQGRIKDKDTYSPMDTDTDQV